MGRSSGRRSSLSLAFSDAGCLAPIRRWLRSRLPADGNLVLDAELVCSELVTNAIEHGGGHGAVRVDIVGDGRVHVEVDDDNPICMLTVGRSRLGKYRGRGLTIVDNVARWGVRRTGTGKTVWAELLTT